MAENAENETLREFFVGCSDKFESIISDVNSVHVDFCYQEAARCDRVDVLRIMLSRGYRFFSSVTTNIAINKRHNIEMLECIMEFRNPDPDPNGEYPCIRYNDNDNDRDKFIFDDQSSVVAAKADFGETTSCEPRDKCAVTEFLFKNGHPPDVNSIMHVIGGYLPYNGKRTHNFEWIDRVRNLDDQMKNKIDTVLHVFNMTYATFRDDVQNLQRNVNQVNKEHLKGIESLDAGVYPWT